MTRTEFASIMAYLAAGSGKALSREATEVYYDLLGDLPEQALQAAARRALLEGQYPTFPPAGTLRKLAVEAAEPGLPPAAEAYRMVLGVLNAPAGLRPGLVEALPVAARQAAEAMGWKSMGDSTEPEVCRAQFTRCYEQYATRQQRERLLPATLRRQLEMLARPRAVPGLPLEERSTDDLA